MKFRLLPLLCALAVPGVASADVHPVDADRVVLQGGFGAGGSVTVEVSNTGAGSLSSTHDALPGGIAGLQYEWAAFPYFVLGGRFGMTRYDWKDTTQVHRTWLDFDAVPMFTFAIDAGPLVLEPRVSVPVGLGMHLWNASDDLIAYDGINRTNFAWNVGGLAGALVHLNRGGDFVRRLGLSMELGFVHHAAFATGTVSNWDYSLRHNQFVMQFGLAVALP